MELNIATPGSGTAAGTVQVSDVTFGKEFNQDLVHQAVVAYLAHNQDVIGANPISANIAE